MSTITQDSIVEKVRSILDRANHPNTPREEAETAFAMAQKLITKYNLDESALADAEAPESIEHETIVISGQYGKRRQSIAYRIAVRNSCAGYVSKAWSSSSRKDVFSVTIYGTKADIFATKVLWTAVDAFIARSLPLGDRTFRTSWLYGFENGISRALHKANNEAVVEHGGNSLVLVQRAERADKEMRATVKLRNVYSRSRIGDGGGYNAGRASGQSFGNAGIGRGAIGALGR